MADPVTLDAGRREGGAALLRGLDEAGAQVVGAAWLHRRDAGSWRLALFTPLVDSAGPRRAYETMLALLGREGADALSVLDVLLASPREHAYRELTALPGAEREEAGHLVKVADAVVRGWTVDALYVYRLGPRPRLRLAADGPKRDGTVPSVRAG